MSFFVQERGGGGGRWPSPSPHLVFFALSSFLSFFSLLLFRNPLKFGYPCVFVLLPVSSFLHFLLCFSLSLCFLSHPFLFPLIPSRPPFPSYSSVSFFSNSVSPFLSFRFPLSTTSFFLFTFLLSPLFLPSLSVNLFLHFCYPSLSPSVLSSPPPFLPLFLSVSPFLLFRSLPLPPSVSPLSPSASSSLLFCFSHTPPLFLHLFALLSLCISTFITALSGVTMLSQHHCNFGGFSLYLLGIQGANVHRELSECPLYHFLWFWHIVVLGYTVVLYVP